MTKNEMLNMIADEVSKEGEPVTAEHIEKASRSDKKFIFRLLCFLLTHKEDAKYRAFTKALVFGIEEKNK